MSLMFNKKDVEMSRHPLVRLLRLIFYRNKITLDRFTTLFAEHGKRMGRPPDMNSTYRNNARKTLSVTHDDMTWRFFHYILSNVLRLDIKEVIIVFKKENGELIEVGSNDPVDKPEGGTQMRDRAE